MAMRRYTKQQLEDELQKKWRLKKTTHRTKTTCAWATPNGNHVLVPVFADGELYADHILNRIEEQLIRFGEHPFTEKK